MGFHSKRTAAGLGPSGLVQSRNIGGEKLCFKMKSCLNWVLYTESFWWSRSGTKSSILHNLCCCCFRQGGLKSSWAARWYRLPYQCKYQLCVPLMWNRVFLFSLYDAFSQHMQLTLNVMSVVFCMMVVLYGWLCFHSHWWPKTAVNVILWGFIFGRHGISGFFLPSEFKST